MESSDRTINSVTVSNIGTATDAEISSVKLYYDSNNSGDYTSGTDTQVGSGTFVSASKTFSGLNITVPGSGTEDLYVVFAGTMDDGITYEIKANVNPLVYWIWIGAAIMILGTIITLLPNKQLPVASSQ